MTYNVQNLFDDIDNGTEYREFDPGRANWNTKFFTAKLKAIAEVIEKSTSGGPDIVALQEIENKNVLEKLVKGYLLRMGYKWIAIVPKAGLAANVGFISRFPIERVHSYYISNYRGNPLRNILECEFDIKGIKLYIFNNHWKSKNGGKAFSEKWRLEASSVLKKRIERILKRDKNAEIIVLGDLNEDYNEYIGIGEKYQTALIPFDSKGPSNYKRHSIFLTDREDSTGLLGTNGDMLVMYEPWYELIDESGTDLGSYVFRGRWETPDHILLSQGLLDGKGLNYERGSFMVVKKRFMIDDSTGFPEKWTMLYRRGYSDHLPLIMRIIIEK